MTSHHDVAVRLRERANCWPAEKYSGPHKALDIEAAELLESQAKALSEAEAERDAARDSAAESGMLAFKWMERHDRIAAGKDGGEYPSPVDVPNVLARAALEAALSDHVVVPREPTQAMLLAAFKEANEQLLRTDGNAHCKSDEERSAHAIAPVYRAMIQAAPPVPEMEG